MLLAPPAALLVLAPLVASAAPVHALAVRAPAVLAPGAAAPSGVQTDDEAAELEALLAEERAEADRERRRGRLRRAERLLAEHLDEEPGDAASRRLLALCRLDEARIEDAEREAARALGDARAGAGTDAEARALEVACARTLAEVHLVRGEGRAALDVLESVRAGLAPAVRPRDAWTHGRALWASGDAEGARRVFATGAAARGELGWEDLLAKARCLRRLGELEAASAALVEADAAATAAEGTEPDVLAELGSVYFEADREVEAAQRRSAANLYKQALEICPVHEGALLGLFELHRYNWRRTSRSATDILAELLGPRPESIEGLIAGASADFDDGQFLSVHRRLEKLGALAPGRREVTTLRAVLAWVERRPEECEALLAGLAATHPGDGRPEREVGRHLLELYRFAEGLPFLRRAVEREPSDHEAWTQLGRALVNTGRAEAAREAFERSVAAGGKRQDAWRDNMMLVLKKIDRECVSARFGDFTFVWRPDGAEILSRYMVPFYQRHLEELSARYGHTPEPTVVQVFRDHTDFSVRSTGFQGFPALGVCFGPVVTAVSPLSQLRRDFSWARTAFHEYAHVVHLGLSHNRCPRWVTEGLVTWEEVQRNPAWTRNMRRELVDAFANGDLIDVRAMNRAFRGPRILFGYYQGGLVFEMLVEQHGFPPMVRLLEAFDRGLTEDQAFAEVLGTTPEEIDAHFREHVAALVADLRIEPRWSKETATKLRLSLARTPPEDAAEREAWAQGVCTLAWSAWQDGRKIDAQEALRRLSALETEPLRARLLRGEILLAGEDAAGAREVWEAAVADGAEEFRMRVALGSIARATGDLEAAEAHFRAAEADFPGFPDKGLAAELRMAELCLALDRADEAMAAYERWLAHNAGEYALRRRVADWHQEHERFAEACRYYREANEIDPFSRDLHRAWGKALRGAGRLEDALEELSTALVVPPALDGDAPGVPEPTEVPEGTPPGGMVIVDRAPDAAERAEILALQAQVLLELGRAGEAAEVARQALSLDGDSPLAREVLDALD